MLRRPQSEQQHRALGTQNPSIYKNPSALPARPCRAVPRRIARDAKNKHRATFVRPIYTILDKRKHQICPSGIRGKHAHAHTREFCSRKQKCMAYTTPDQHFCALCVCVCVAPLAHVPIHVHALPDIHTSSTHRNTPYRTAAESSVNKIRPSFCPNGPSSALHRRSTPGIIDNAHTHTHIYIHSSALASGYMNTHTHTHTWERVHHSTRFSSPTHTRTQYLHEHSQMQTNMHPAL